ncbi:hypothetical protein EYZ11_005577 [Aspergillus tanneri]|uniref:Uncharacterized protein n=1 Tax=Aspergillus tanneri TaxID=1220188 RepID=A0A4S3JK30_9EURO|nr:hypothetical protein EYZ11_005577 [Aspergillus tanneri]
MAISIFYILDLSIEVRGA